MRHKSSLTTGINPGSSGYSAWGKNYINLTFTDSHDPSTAVEGSPSTDFNYEWLHSGLSSSVFSENSFPVGILTTVTCFMQIGGIESGGTVTANFRIPIARQAAIDWASDKSLPDIGGDANFNRFAIKNIISEWRVFDRDHSPNTYFLVVPTNDSYASLYIGEIDGTSPTLAYIHIQGTFTDDTERDELQADYALANPGDWGGAGGQVEFSYA